jgi:hypothetical protein
MTETENISLMIIGEKNRISEIVDNLNINIKNKENILYIMQKLEQPIICKCNNTIYNINTKIEIAQCHLYAEYCERNYYCIFVIDMDNMNILYPIVYTYNNNIYNNNELINIWLQNHIIKYNKSIIKQLNNIDMLIYYIIA